MRIFIGWDPRIPMAGEVLAYSLGKYTKNPDIEIEFLELSRLKKTIGFTRAVDPLASTEFTYTRFLVPYLCGYQGKALFLDNDMLCLSDIQEIFDLDMTDYALRVVKHEYNPTATIKMDGKVQTTYPRKNWSSMMFMDCSKLRCWTKEAVETQTGAWLHRFEAVPDEQIGEIPKTWNVLDQLNPDTKLAHFTSGGPYFKGYEDCPGSAQWYRHYYDMQNGR